MQSAYKRATQMGTSQQSYQGDDVPSDQHHGKLETCNRNSKDHVYGKSCGHNDKRSKHHFPGREVKELPILEFAHPSADANHQSNTAAKSITISGRQPQQIKSRQAHQKTGKQIESAESLSIRSTPESSQLGDTLNHCNSAKATKPQTSYQKHKSAHTISATHLGTLTWAMLRDKFSISSPSSLDGNNEKPLVEQTDILRPLTDITGFEGPILFITPRNDEDVTNSFIAAQSRFILGVQQHHDIELLRNDMEFEKVKGIMSQLLGNSTLQANIPKRGTEIVQGHTLHEGSLKMLKNRDCFEPESWMGTITKLSKTDGPGCSSTNTLIIPILRPSIAEQAPLICSLEPTPNSNQNSTDSNKQTGYQQRPKALIVTSVSFFQERNKSLHDDVKEYVESGGTLIIVGQWNSLTKANDVFLFLKHMGLPWKSAGYGREIVHVNIYGVNKQTYNQISPLFGPYTYYLKNVDQRDSRYRMQDHDTNQELAPVAMTDIGRGRFGIMGGYEERKRPGYHNKCSLTDILIAMCGFKGEVWGETRTSASLGD
jgi:hypothetical protein